MCINYWTKVQFRHVHIRPEVDQEGIFSGSPFLKLFVFWGFYKPVLVFRLCSY